MKDERNDRLLPQLLLHLTNLADVLIAYFWLLVGLPTLAAGVIYGFTHFRPYLIHAYLLIAVIGFLTLTATVLTIQSVTARTRTITRGCILFACAALAVLNHWVVELLPASVLAAGVLTLLTTEWLLQKRLPSECSYFDSAGPIAWRLRSYRLAGILGFVGLPLFCLGVWNASTVLIEQWRSTNWPTAQARVAAVVLPEDEYWNRALSLQYEFSVNEATYTGNRDGVISTGGLAYHPKAEQRSKELNRAGYATVSYKPTYPSQNLLSPGVTYEPFLWVLNELYLLVLFCASWPLLLASRRGQVDPNNLYGPRLTSVLVAMMIVCCIVKLPLTWPDLATGAPWALAVIAVAAVYAAVKRVQPDSEVDSQADPTAAGV